MENIMRASFVAEGATTNPAAPANVVRAAIEDAKRRTEKAQADLSKAMDALDTAIRDKTEQLHKLQINSVSQPQVAEAVAASLREYLARERSNLLEPGRHFASLRAYHPVASFSVITGDGEHLKSVTDRQPFNWHGLLTNPSGSLSAAALALLLGDADIDAFAQSAARASGAPEASPSVDELATQAAALAAELEVLHAQRKELRDQLSEFIDVTLSPLVSDDFFNRQPGSDGAPTSGPPTVRVAGGMVHPGPDPLSVHYALLAQDAAKHRQDNPDLYPAYVYPELHLELYPEHGKQKD